MNEYSNKGYALMWHIVFFLIGQGAMIATYFISKESGIDNLYYDLILIVVMLFLIVFMAITLRKNWWSLEYKDNVLKVKRGNNTKEMVNSNLFISSSFNIVTYQINIIFKNDSETYTIPSVMFGDKYIKAWFNGLNKS